MKAYIVWVAAPCDSDDSSSRVCVCVCVCVCVGDTWADWWSRLMCFFTFLNMQMFFFFIQESNSKEKGSVWADNWGNPLKMQYSEHITAAITQ